MSFSIQSSLSKYIIEPVQQFFASNRTIKIVALALVVLALLVSCVSGTKKNLQEVRILEVVKPQIPNRTAIENVHVLKNTEVIEGLLEHLKKDVVDLEYLKKSKDQLSIYSPATKHLTTLIEELVSGKYTDRDIKEYLNWNLKLSLNQLKTNPTTVKKVEALYKRIITKDYEMVKRDGSNYGHTPSYFLVDKTTKLPFAIFKQSNPEFLSSFKKLVPDLLLSSPVWEHEQIGYEEDQLMGFDHTPTTLVAKFLNSENQEKMGVIQEFVPNSKGGGDFYTPEGAELLKAIPKSHVHCFALSGIFKGLSAAHMNNYILQLNQAGDQIQSIFEIDLEEMLLPYNRLSLNERQLTIDQIKEQIKELQKKEPIPVDEIKVLEKKQLMAAKSLILCRMWTLGLPQNGIPFDRAALLAMTHPGLLPMLKEYQEVASKKTKMDNESWVAQYERVQLMIDLCQAALRGPNSTLTPRDLYFAAFGGEHLWKLAQEKGYPAMLAFNNLISDPYQHVVKDFGAPQDIPVCTRLEEPRDKSSKESWDIMNFYRAMEGLAPKPLPEFDEPKK